MIIGYIVLGCLFIGLAVGAVQALIWLFQNLGTILWVIVAIVSAVFLFFIFGPWVATLSPTTLLIFYLATRDSNRDSRPPL